MMTLYIPINSNSLAHYFSKALILPAKFFSNKPEDIQNRLTNSILISTKRWVKSSDCSLEIILTDAEIKSLKKLSDIFFQLDRPIPISRIKKIYFLDSKQKDTTIWNINNGAAFVPENIVIVDTNVSNDFANDIFTLNDNSNSSSLTREIEEKAKRFDIILGGFAFMKVGGEDFMNFTENYFVTLSYFNKLIEEQTLKAEREKKLKFSRKYIGLFSKNDSGEWAKWQPYIYKNIELQDIENLALRDGIKLERRLGLIDTSSIKNDSHLYDIAILASYGDRKNKSTEDLVNNLHNGNISSDKTEDISLLFGLNTGYSKLRNKYKTKNKEYDVKFRLESKLDYYIIESIYEFAFNGNKSSFNFSYIDEWQTNKTSKINSKGFDTYSILDTIVVAKKKQTALEYFLEKYSKDIYETMAKSTKPWLPPFVSIDNALANRYFENTLKSHFLNAIQDIEKKISSEYEQIIEVETQELKSNYENELLKLKNEILKLKEENNSIVKKQFNSDVLPPFSQNVSDIRDKTSLSIVSEPTTKYGEKNYADLTLAELKKVAKEMCIKNYAKKNKDEILILIKNTLTLSI